MRGLALLLGLALAACASDRPSLGPDLARSAGWRWEILSAGAFDLAAASSDRSGGDLLVVYLEGDGFAYVRARQPSADPTPADPLALRLALAHPGQAPAAWLGRPCQYTMADHRRNCGVAYWTNARHAPEAIDSMSAGLDQLKLRSGASRLILVGYSGGGAMAALLAARRSDVVGLVTIAADLDLDYWVRRDGYAPLTGSLDPARSASALGAVPQIHFTGAKDKTVGTDVVQSFMRQLPPGTPVRLVEVPGYSHFCCWDLDWRQLASVSAMASLPGW